MKKINFLFPLIVLLLFSACRQDEDTMGTSVTTPPFPIIENYNPEVKPVTSSVDGKVQDTNKEAIANATVRLGNRSTLTDEYGFFSFENATMNEKGTFITVTQNGFLDGSRRFFPREGNKNKVVIEMITESFQPSFEAATGGSITIDGTTGVTFPANSIVNANGEVFDGEVFATHAYLDPSASTTADRMPGNLQGVQDDLEEVALQSFGMINVSLQDIDGAPLNIGEGFTATISVALPASITANAPNEIPLWSFNEQFGIWVEEGTATKINGHYVGEVKHFSWWNCDAPFPLIELDVTLTDENQNPVSNHIVAIGFGSDSLATHYSYTNENGFTSGKVPAGETLILQIRGLCGAVIYSEFIGPFTEDTSLDPIAIEDSNVNDTEITGTIVDCDGNLITNGGVIVEIDQVNYTRVVEDGTFNFFISTCDGATDLTVKGLDFNTLKQSDLVTGIVGTLVNTGALEVCDEQIDENTFVLNIGSDTYNYFGDGLTGSVSPNGVIIIQYEASDSLGEETYIFLQANGTTAGNYDNNNFCSFQDYSQLQGPDYNLRGIDSSAQGINLANFEISTLTPTLSGTFEDMLINQASNNTDPVLVSGSFTIIQ